MSAGGLSYSVINSYGKATLPSVDSWGTNMNILRDPPKSVWTRKIDKVNENSDITQMIQDSGDRVCEAITQYARGVNPFVSVSYTNAGNNGGQRVGGCDPSSKYSSMSAKLPYRIMEGGVFRPPLLSVQNLTPLSRQPRAWTSSNTNPEFIDFTKKLKCQSSNVQDYRELRNDVLKGHVRPTAVYQIEKPIENNGYSKYNIQDKLNVHGHSGVRSMDLTTQQVSKPHHTVLENPNHTAATSNIGTTRINQSNPITTLQTERFTQDLPLNTATSNPSQNIQSNNTQQAGDIHIKTQNPIHNTATSNPSKNINVTPIDEIMDVDIRTKEVLSTNYTTPISSIKEDIYLSTDIDLSNKLPHYIAQTNAGKNIYKNTVKQNDIVLERKLPDVTFTSNPGVYNKQADQYRINTREKHLPKQAHYGDFAPRANLPLINKNSQINENYTSEKAIMSQKVLHAMQDRYKY